MSWASFIQGSFRTLLFSFNFSTSFSQSLACCTQGCGVTSRLVRLGAMGRDRPPWNGQQCPICWKVLNSASAESLETRQENSDRCLKWNKNSTKPKDARPSRRRHARATEQAARQSVNVKMQMRPARIHTRTAPTPASTPSRGTGVVGGAKGVHRVPSRESFENKVRAERGAEMRTRRTTSSRRSRIGLQQGRTTARTTSRTSVGERSRLLPSADPRSRGSPRRQMRNSRHWWSRGATRGRRSGRSRLLLLLRRLLRIVCRTAAGNRGHGVPVVDAAAAGAGDAAGSAETAGAADAAGAVEAATMASDRGIMLAVTV